jgi:uncharacterized protein
MTSQIVNNTSTVSNAAENLELTRRGYDAFNTANLEVLTELCAENLTWHTPGRSFLAGDHTGRDATFAQFGRYGGETNGTFRAELKQLFVGEDGRVIAIHHNVAERNGKHLDVDCCLIFEIKDGRLVDGRECFYNLYAWDEFWS